MSLSRRVALVVALLSGLGALAAGPVRAQQSAFAPPDLSQYARQSQLTGYALVAALNSLATKSDLVPLALKTDLSSLALRSELTPLALKTDLVPLALKTDLTSLALKTDLSVLATKSELTPLALKTQVVRTVNGAAGDVSVLVYTDAAARAAVAGLYLPVGTVPTSCAASGYAPVWNGTAFACGSLSAVLPGTFTVATLPVASANQAKYAFVTNLGGGADMVLSDGTYWKHIRQGVVTDVASGGSLTITPLVSPPIMRLTGTTIATTLMTISTSNLYPGATFRIIVPGTLATLATIGVQVSGVTGVLNMLGASWQDVQWNGTVLVKTAGGLL